MLAILIILCILNLFWIYFNVFSLLVYFQEYKYDRFIDAKFSKNGRELRNPLLAFGSLCPGKRLAITQVKWYLFNLAHQFEIKTANGQTCKPDVHYHGHEILPPTNDVNILYRKKENVRRLEFVQWTFFRQEIALEETGLRANPSP